MSSEDAFDLHQDRRVKLWSASIGTLFSGTLRGILTANLANGQIHHRAECTTPAVACELAKDLNLLLELGTAEKIRNAKARREIQELLDLAEMLPGRDNKNNWARKLRWIQDQFSG